MNNRLNDVIKELCARYDMSIVNAQYEPEDIEFDYDVDQFTLRDVMDQPNDILSLIEEMNEELGMINSLLGGNDSYSTDETALRAVMRFIIQQVNAMEAHYERTKNFIYQLECSVDMDTPLLREDAARQSGLELLEDVAPDELKPYLDEDRFVNDYMTDWSQFNAPDGTEFYYR